MSDGIRISWLFLKLHIFEEGFWFRVFGKGLVVLHNTKMPQMFFERRNPKSRPTIPFTNYRIGILR